MKKIFNSAIAFTMLFCLGFINTTEAVCPVTKTNGGGFTTTIESVVMNCNGSYTIKLLLVHDGCPGPVCKELSHLSIQATSGTYSSVSKTIVSGSMTGGALDLGPNIGESFQGFKFDNTGHIGDGNAGSVRITYTLTALQNQQVSAKAGTNAQIASFTIADFQGVANCNGTATALPYLPAIQGSSTVCTGSTLTVTDSVTGGTWSSSNTAVATVNSLGVVTPVAAGTDTIRYTLTNTCGTTTVRKVITVSAAPTVNSTSGANYFCVAATTQLSNTTTGGVWASSNTAIATVNTSGLVTGVAAGGVKYHLHRNNRLRKCCGNKGLNG